MLTRKDGSKVLHVMGAIWLSMEKKKQKGIASHDIIIRPSYISNIPVEGSLPCRVMCLNVMFLLEWREFFGMMRHLVTSHHVQ